METYRSFCEALHEVFTPDKPNDVICEMMAFANLSVLQAAYCTHFRRHEIDLDITTGPSDDNDGDGPDSGEFDEAIIERLTHTSMLMCVCFDAVLGLPRHAGLADRVDSMLPAAAWPIERGGDGAMQLCPPPHQQTSNEPFSKD